jgi:hypothetical protein
VSFTRRLVLVILTSDLIPTVSRTAPPDQGVVSDEKLTQAHIIVKRIMKRFKLTPQVYAELDVGGVDWDKAGDNAMDLSPLFV